MKQEDKDTVKLIMFGPTRSPLAPLGVLVFYVLLFVMIFGVILK